MASQKRYKIIKKWLNKQGFHEDTTKGSHVKFVRADGNALTVVNKVKHVVGMKKVLEKQISALN